MSRLGMPKAGLVDIRAGLRIGVSARAGSSCAGMFSCSNRRGEFQFLAGDAA